MSTGRLASAIGLENCLLGSDKDNCYANHPGMIDLMHEINVAMGVIEGHTIENVLKNWVDRMTFFYKSFRCNHMKKLPNNSKIKKIFLKYSTIYIKFI